ncbi:MAG: YggS family pyridoxal phosphate-dependent enzyme [Clostridium sp.]
MDISSNISEIRKIIPENIKLICVSKTKPLKDILDAYNFGERDFGENKVQELIEKYTEAPKDIRWHLIGKLQRNKVKYIVGKVNLIHSLDSIKLLEEIEKVYRRENETAEVLIQINIGREESKSGALMEDLQELLISCENCSNVKVKGLMAIIPKGDINENKICFKKMKNIFDEISARKFVNISMEYLSMGMSSDYLEAIEEGANVIRIGKDVFGRRE